MTAGDAQIWQAAVEERRNRNLVGGIEHGGRVTADASAR